MYIVIDESGEMGHDLSKEGTSRYFVVAALVIHDEKTRKAVEVAVKRTLKSKVLAGKGKAEKVKSHTELKGASTSFKVKRYFWRQVEDLNFDLYAVIVEKDDRYPKLTPARKEELYRVLVGLLCDRMNLNSGHNYIEIYVDEGRKKRGEFDRVLKERLLKLTSDETAVVINHVQSHQYKPIQAIDLFAWGIERKNEHRERRWYDLFQKKIKGELSLRVRF